MRLRHTRRRSGFTLVELIVAAGLTVLIMAILATGFQVGLDSLRTLKATGDLADRLRTAENLLRFDLEAPHFDDGSNPGIKRLSDFRFDRPGTPEAAVPTGGFFQIRQPVHPVGFITLERADQDQLSSTRALTHGVSFTMRRTGKTPGDLFAAVDGGMGPILAQQTNQTDVAVNPNTFMTEWAEVHWFLDLSRPTNVNGVDTFPLCRRVRLLTPKPVGGVAQGSQLAEVVSGPAVVATPSVLVGQTNNLESIANPANRLPEVNVGGVLSRAHQPTLTNPLGASNPYFGDDIVITNVVSFEVKPTGVCPTVPAWPRTTLPTGAFNADFPFDDLPTNLSQFDTAQGGFMPGQVPARITGVQIKIRVYNGSNKLTRQAVVTSKL